MKPGTASLRETLRHAREFGFSLVELMIALTLGLLVIGAVGSVYVSGKVNFNEREGMATVQENARTALLLVDAVIRNAGYRSDPRQQNDPAVYFAGPQSAVSGGSAQNLNTAYSFSSNAITGTDYVAVSFLGNDDGSTTTCLGSTVVSDQIGTSVFYVGKSASDSVASLYCASEIVSADAPHAIVKAFSTEPLLMGVVNLAVVYGIDSNGDGVIDRYTDAAAIAAGNSWTQVQSLQLDLTLQSPDVVDPLAANSDKVVNGHLQRSLTQTIALRNPLTQ